MLIPTRELHNSQRTNFRFHESLHFSYIVLPLPSFPVFAYKNLHDDNNDNDMVAVISNISFHGHGIGHGLLHNSKRPCIDLRPSVTINVSSYCMADLLHFCDMVFCYTLAIIRTKFVCITYLSTIPLSTTFLWFFASCALDGCD